MTRRPPRRILRGDRVKAVARERPPKPDPQPIPEIHPSSLILPKLLGTFTPFPEPHVPTLAELVGDYAVIITRCGIESQEAERFRFGHRDNSALLEYCDGLDNLKRGLNPGNPIEVITLEAATAPETAK